MKFGACASVALGVVLCAACTLDSGSEDGTVSATFEPIIGGTVASSYPEAAYLNIDMTTTGGYACSASLITPRVVLTAGHCVDGHSRFEVHVGNAYQVSTSAAVYDWNEHGAETVNPKHHDIGLIFLSSPINIASYPTLSKVKLADSTKAINVGRVLNGAVQAAAYQAPATISAADKIGYPYDYTSADVIQPGDSGGPVFLAGTHTLVAVNSGAGGNTQVLARVDLLSDWIQSQITAHLAPTPSSGAGGAGGSGGASGGAGGKSSAGAGGVAGAAGAKASDGRGGTAGVGGVAGAAGAKGGAGGVGGVSGVSGAGGTAGAAGAKAGVAGSASGSTACVGTKEQEANDALTSANKVTGATCGELSSATDVDWFSTSVSPGSHVIELVASGDANAALGVVSGSTCIVSVASTVRTNLTVSGAAVNVCIKASSPTKKPQTYRLNVN